MAIGNVAAASPTGVLPKMTYTRFIESRSTPLISQVQNDGTTLQSLIIDTLNPVTSIKAWQLGVRLTATTLATFISFYEAHVGGIPFYFYDPMSPATGQQIGSNYDSTGVSTQGRYTVRFASDSYTTTVGLSRTDIAFTLQEVA